MTFSGPIAGGPWHGSNMDGENPTIQCPILQAGQVMLRPPKSVEQVANIQAATYRWHFQMKMWIWEGPDVPIRK